MLLKLGPGGSGVGKILSMLGDAGSSSCERSFSRHAPKIMQEIRDECAIIFIESFKNEMIETLESQLKWLDKSEKMEENLK